MSINTRRLWLLGTLLLIMALLSLYLGASNLAPTQIIQRLLSGSDFIIAQYRLPRALLAIATGAGLGVSGALVQGIIRNPLASPDLIGISSGAGLAATALLVFFPHAPASYLPLSALAGGIITAAIIIFIVFTHAPSPAHLALIGIAVGAFLASSTQFILLLRPLEMNSAMIWLTGSLWGRDWSQMPEIWLSLLVILPVAFALAWRLDIMGLGEDSAYSLGVNPRRVQLLALGCAVILASISVSVCGTISFVGLLAPHLARLLFGHNHKLVLAGSALSGALLILSADTLARNLHPPLELPAGVLTSLIGAPYFVFLMQRHKGWS